jgi:hypothetical protein
MSKAIASFSGVAQGFGTLEINKSIFMYVVSQAISLKYNQDHGTSRSIKIQVVSVLLSTHVDI